MMIGLKQSSTRSLMKPANEDMMASRPVSKAVGNVKNNGPAAELRTIVSLGDVAAPSDLPHTRTEQDQQLSIHPQLKR
jgi:hypothetical protein